MRLLDTYCKAGGAGAGYARAGFEVVGVDIEPQPHFPYEFVQGDAIEHILAHGHEFDAIHASPPCQRYSNMTHRGNGQASHLDLVASTREALIATGVPYVIENVVGAPLLHPVTLCGSSFGLRVRRHRLFESNVLLSALPCAHAWQNESKIFDIYQHYRWYKSGIVHVSGDPSMKGGHWREAMGIGWMTNKELAQAVPPAYTEYIGKQVYEYITRENPEP